MNVSHNLDLWGGCQGINGIFAHVHFSVSPVALDTHAVVSFLVLECTVKMEVLNNWLNPCIYFLTRGWGKDPLPKMIK